ncbi:MAG: hypothetical protein WAP74_03485 [Patescibacteria group bacterium]
MSEQAADISTWPIEFLDKQATCPCGATVSLHINHDQGSEKRFDGHLMVRDEGAPRPCPYHGKPISQEQ